MVVICSNRLKIYKLQIVFEEDRDVSDSKSEENAKLCISENLLIAREI